MVKTGKKVNNFSATATGDKTISLKQLAGKKVILYFYPKDNTPGCTTEGQDFVMLKQNLPDRTQSYLVFHATA